MEEDNAKLAEQKAFFESKLKTFEDAYKEEMDKKKSEVQELRKVQEELKQHMKEQDESFHKQTEETNLNMVKLIQEKKSEIDDVTGMLDKMTKAFHLEHEARVLDDRDAEGIARLL
jgi:hypothetical protein